MGIANCTNDDIGSDVGHPGAKMRMAMAVAITAVGGALLAWSLAECRFGTGIAGAVVFGLGVVALDRTRRGIRVPRDVTPMPLGPAGRDDGPRDGEPEQELRRTTAAATTAPTTLGPCGDIIHAMTERYLPAPLAPGTRIRLCDPQGQVFADIRIGAPSTVDYPLTGNDETSTLAQVSHVMVEGSTAAGYTVTLL